MNPNLSAVELLDYMRAGAIVKVRLKRRAFIGRSKLICRLIMPNAEVMPVQKSAVDALVRAGAVQSFFWQNGEADYYMPGISKPGRYFG